MKNKIIKLTKENAGFLDQLHETPDTLVVRIDGSKIDNWKEYIEALDPFIHFPDDCTTIIARYSDWMTDLGWLGKKAYVVIIDHYSALMKNDLRDKKLVYEIFEEEILPFWDDEVEYVVGPGRKKPFNVYLVD